MDHQAFLVWLNEIDDLSSKQRAETGRLVAGVSSLESVIDLPEANVREGRICPHCASGGAIIRGHASGLTRFFCKSCRKTWCDYGGRSPVANEVQYIGPHGK